MTKNNKLNEVLIRIKVQEPYLLMSNLYYNVVDKVIMSCLVFTNLHDIYVGNTIGHEELLRKLEALDENTNEEIKNTENHNFIQRIFKRKKDKEIKLAYTFLFNSIPELQNYLNDEDENLNVKRIFKMTTEELINRLKSKRSYIDLTLYLQMKYEIYGSKVLSVLINYFYSRIIPTIDLFANSLINNTYVPLFRMHLSHESTGDRMIGINKMFPTKAIDYMRLYSSNAFDRSFEISYTTKIKEDAKKYSISDVIFLFFVNLLKGNCIEITKPFATAFETHLNDIRDLAYYTELLLRYSLENRYDEINILGEIIFERITVNRQNELLGLLEKIQINEVERKSIDFESVKFNFLDFCERFYKSGRNIKYIISFNQEEWETFNSK